MKTKKGKTMFARRQGETTLNIDSRSVRVDLAEEFVCGGVEDEFEYECQITTRGLSQEGFVTEVKAFMDAVDKAFDPRNGLLRASCEELAQGVAFVAHKQTKGMVQCYVEVKNLTGSVIYLWNKGEKVPTFPSLAPIYSRKVRPQRVAKSQC